MGEKGSAIDASVLVAVAIETDPAKRNPPECSRPSPTSKSNTKVGKSLGRFRLRRNEESRPDRTCHCHGHTGRYGVKWRGVDAGCRLQYGMDPVMSWFTPSWSLSSSRLEDFGGKQSRSDSFFHFFLHRRFVVLPHQEDDRGSRSIVDQRVERSIQHHSSGLRTVSYFAKGDFAVRFSVL